MQWYVMTALAAFAVSWLLGGILLPLLRRLKAGQPIRSNGPKTHLKKAGTPTMGGIQFIVAGLGVAGAAGYLLYRNAQASWDFAFIGGLAVCAYALIGFADDWIKVRRKNSGGLSARGKLAMQTVFSLALAVWLYRHEMVGSTIIVPFTALEWDFGLFYIPLATLLLVFMTNSANLLDGLDGLLGGVATLDLLTYAAICMMLSIGAQAGVSENLFALGLFNVAGVGALLGFLRYNSHPAHFIMGDTGSMALGAWVTVTALLTRTPLLLLLVALMMVASSVSVMLQVAAVKITGHRVFRMSPLHHHYELGGVPETRIVSMYTLITAALCMVAILSL